MADFLFLMHADIDDGTAIADWGPYLTRLSDLGVLRGGSAIGDGVTVKQTGAALPVSATLIGYVKVEAPDFEAAAALVEGNPVHQAGGTVEIRELPVSG
jgi:hypothetical protein